MQSDSIELLFIDCYLIGKQRPDSIPEITDHPPIKAHFVWTVIKTGHQAHI